MERYYEMQLRERAPSAYSTFRLPQEVSEYEIGRGVLGVADTYTKQIKILNTLGRAQKIKVNEHEQQHLKDPSLPEGFVRDLTQTHLN